MKRKFLAFVLLITAGLSLSSCLSSDDDTNIEYSHDTAITAFSLGNLGQYVKRNTTGKMDSLVASAVTGTNYTFTIDQANRKIYNEDSLPALTRTAAALATISAKNSSYIQLIYDKNVVKEGEDKDSIVWYSSSDSINFDQLNKEKNIRVYAQDASAYADYLLTVNVHKEFPDSFVWHSLAHGNAALNSSVGAEKTLVLGNGTVCVLGKNAEDKTVVLTSADGKNWETASTLSSSASQSVATLDGKLFVIEDGKVMTSADAKTWNMVAENQSLTQLLGASSKYLYARSADAIYASADGETWTKQAMDNATVCLPITNISLNAINIASVKNAESLLLVGTRDAAYGDTIAVAWTGTADYSLPIGDNKWNYIEYDKNQAGKLPYLAQLAVTTSSEGLVALGSNGKWYRSLNGGIKWTVDTLMTLPTGFDASKPFSLVRATEKLTAADGTQYDGHFYWLINAGNAWRGRSNKEAWLKQD